MAAPTTARIVDPSGNTLRLVDSATTAEAAPAQLGCAPRTICLAIAGGRLPAVRTPHSRRIRPADLDPLRRPRAA